MTAGTIRVSHRLPAPRPRAARVVGAGSAGMRMTAAGSRGGQAYSG